MKRVDTGDKHIVFKSMKDKWKEDLILAGEEPFIMMEAIALDNTIIIPQNLLKNMIWMEIKFMKKYIIYSIENYALIILI